MNLIRKNAPVAINRCFEYDYSKIKQVLENQFNSVIGSADFFRDKNVVLKPNLLMKASPDKSVTTHPMVMEAVIDIIKSYGPRSVKIAESPGGPYNATSLGIIYRSTGMTAVAEKCGIELNFDTTAEHVSNPDGAVCKVFNIISPIKNADVIVNMCKLKTHSLTAMSAATKNFFGTIPGIEKFEMHTRFKDLKIFEAMLADLCAMHCQRVPVLSVVDAVYGMEGNGPSGGDKRNFGLLLSSLNPFNLDVACSSIIGLGNEVGYIEEGKKKGICVLSSNDLTIIGEPLAECKVSDLKLPETKSLTMLKKLPTFLGGRLNKFFEPRPQIIKKKCVGCGECMRSCPAKTITLVAYKKGKKIAKINDENCIKCYCCQELCPINSVKIKKNFIFKIIR